MTKIFGGDIKSPRDLKGYRKGALIAIRPVGKDKHGHALWEVLCEKCGKKKIMNMVQFLDNKNTKDCGCTPVRGYDFTGCDIGTYTVIKPVGLDARNNRLWLCKCRVCKQNCILPTQHLKPWGDRKTKACPNCGAWSPKTYEQGKHNE